MKINRNKYHKNHGNEMKLNKIFIYIICIFNIYQKISYLSLKLKKKINIKIYYYFTLK